MKKYYYIKSIFPEYDTNTVAHALKENSRKAKDNAYRELLKSKNFGLEYCANSMKCGKYGIPLIDPYYGDLPEFYVSVSNPACQDPSKTCLTCLDYDYILERLWDNPYKYVDMVNSFLCFGTPDFSMKVDDTLAVQIANTHRNHALAFFYQEHGATSFPSMSWSSTDSYEFCFDGYSRGGAVLVSTIGTHRDERSKFYFKKGFFEMLKRINPDAVVLYGDGDREKFPWLPNLLEVRFVLPYRYKRARNYGR